MLDYRHRSALETARRVRAGETTAAAVLAEALDAARADAALGAFATLTPEFAAEQAASVDGALARGERLGPLAGVPVPIKDLAEVAGLPFEAGSAVLRGTIAQSTDAVAQRLIDAGSLTVGKTATPEFGFPPYTE
ncbi:MAG: amidase family protein, partial [Propioniciclava sp.]